MSGPRSLACKIRDRSDEFWSPSLRSYSVACFFMTLDLRSETLLKTLWYCAFRSNDFSYVLLLKYKTVVSRIVEVSSSISSSGLGTGGDSEF